VRAIRRGDAALVATVPGIGRKTAERVILELRDKLDSLSPGEAPVGPGPSEAVTAAVEGLVGLGFREPEARAAVSAVSRSRCESWSRQRGSEANRSTTSFCMGRPVWARRLLRRSSPTRWAWERA
ncbi:MAG: hypothetical protein E6I33_02620, partial [Chloroflexi bacterium]